MLIGASYADKLNLIVHDSAVLMFDFGREHPAYEYAAHYDGIRWVYHAELSKETA